MFFYHRVVCFVLGLLIMLHISYSCFVSIRLRGHGDYLSYYRGVMCMNMTFRKRHIFVHRFFHRPIPYYSNSSAAFNDSILKSGDIESNPGPKKMVNSNSDTCTDHRKPKINTHQENTSKASNSLSHTGRPNFKHTPYFHSIMFGSFHQGDVIFPETSRAKQCTCINAFMFHCYSKFFIQCCNWNARLS
jgi:hypothetical protein